MILSGLTIGDGAVVMAGSGVGQDVPPQAVLIGYPAQPKERWFEQLVHLRRLKMMLSDLLDLKERMHRLESGRAAERPRPGATERRGP